MERGTATITPVLHTGRHFLQIPGPTNVPDRVLRAMAAPVIDHRGPEFAALTAEVLDGLRLVFGTRGAVVIYTASGTGAIEAAFVNTLSPGDRVLIFETGYFSSLWRQVATSFGLDVDYVSGDWRHGASVTDLEARLSADGQRSIKAVVVVHNETSTGVTSRIADLRRAMNGLGHPALLMVDTVSSLASMDYRHDEWEVDVTACGSQKGLMVPPGLSFNAISEKAIAAGRQAKLPRQYWDWTEMIKQHRSGYFAYTPATNLLFALREALAMLQEEGLATGVRPARSPCGSDAGGGARLGSRDRVRRPARVLELTDRGVHAGRPQRRRAAPDCARSVRHVAWHGARTACGPRVPHRPSRPLQRPDAGRNAGRCRDGSARRRRAAPRGRCDRGPSRARA